MISRKHRKPHQTQRWIYQCKYARLTSRSSRGWKRVLRHHFSSCRTMAGSPLSVPSLQAIAVPGTASIIFFLAYSSQYLFYYIEPRPLNKSQALWFNGLMLAVWWSYDRTVTVDPGRKGWVERAVKSVGDEGENESEAATLKKGLRWCRKCDAVKPPRAHHCRQCGR